MDFEFTEHPSTATTGSNDQHPDQLFLDIIPFLSVEEIEIPNLRQVANDAAKTRTLTEIYNKDTYMEFHRLLCFMLNRFYRSLTALQAYHSLSSKSKSGILDSDTFKIINNLLNAVTVSGRCLRGIVRSAAIEKHLKTIACFLEVNDMKSWMLTPADEEEDELHDLEPYSMYQGHCYLPWQSYRDWLRLTILYFDAAIVLLDHVRSLPSSASSVDISIKILSPPLPDQHQKMLPWKKLLRNEVYFPKMPEDSQLSVEDLITFLTSDFNIITESTHNDSERQESNSTKREKDKGAWLDQPRTTSIETVYRSVENLKKKQKLANAAEGVHTAIWTMDIEEITGQMKLLSNCSSPGANEYISAIFRRLDALKQCPTPSRLARTQEILDMFDALRTHSFLYQQLKNGTPLSRGDRFFGTRHCEVCIASILGNPGPRQCYESQFQDIRSEISVSRFSCFARMFLKFYNIEMYTSYRCIEKMLPRVCSLAQAFEYT